MEAQKDSAKTKHLAVYVSPSQVFFGDIPFGIEHKITKKIFHECFFQFKVANPISNVYNFNKGFGFKYFLKYNLLRSKKNYLCLNLGYNYRNVFFTNKNEITPFYQSQGVMADISPKYNTDLRRIKNSLIFGFSFESRLFKKLYYGANLFFEYSTQIDNYTIKDSRFDLHYNYDNPYYLQRTNYYYSINFIFKLGYEIY